MRDDFRGVRGPDYRFVALWFPAALAGLWALLVLLKIGETSATTLGGIVTLALWPILIAIAHGRVRHYRFVLSETGLTRELPPPRQHIPWHEVVQVQGNATVEFPEGALIVRSEREEIAVPVVIGDRERLKAIVARRTGVRL